MTTDEQYAKLPKHAQETIERLRRELREAQVEVVELKNELAPPPGYGEAGVRYWRMAEERALPVDSTVCFRVGDHGDVRIMVQKDRHGKSFLDICGDQRLTVHPQASNYVQIYHPLR